MNEKDAYKDIFHGWMARAAEYKMAIALAAACTVVILISLVWPKPKPAPTINGVNTTPPASHAFTAAPPTEPAPAPASKPATPPPSPAPSPMERELTAKPLFPPPATTSKPAPTPAPQQAAPPPKAPTAKTAMSGGSSSLPPGYYVQVGSFADKQHAIALAGKVEDKHWQAHIAPRPGGLHAVWVGPYPTKPDVDKAKQGLEKDTGLSGFIVESK